MKRVLIISGGLQVGGAERVAANISRYAPKGKFEFHYLVFEGIDNVYGPEIEKDGGKVITIPSPAKGYGRYIKNVSRLIKEGNYVAVHSHTMFNSGLNLLIAKFHRVPHRITHSHTTRTEKKTSVVQRLYEGFMKGMINFSATQLFSCGVEAGYWLFGKKAFDKKGLVIRNGIDIDSFRWSEESRDRIREAYSLKDSFVIGHSGTLLPLKNQELLIRLMPRILEKKPKAFLLLLGGGDEQYAQELKALAQSLGVGDAVRFCGSVSNVGEHLSALDVFAFPSLREGTPLALIEAQTNGLPCIIADCIPKDACLTDLILPLPLENTQQWIEALCNAERADPGKSAELIRTKGYGVESCFQPIYDTYLR